MTINRGSFWLLSIFYLFYFALIGVYIIFLPKMLLQSGYSAIEVGLIFSASPMMRFLLPFYFRYIKGVHKKHYLIALSLSLFASILFFITIKSFIAFFIVNLLYGASMGVILPYVDTLALQVVSAKYYGRVRLWGSIGFMAIALWLGRVLKSPVQSLTYLSLLALFTLISGWLLVGFNNKEKEDSTSSITHPFSLKRYWAFWLSAFLLQVSFGAFYNFFTIYETANGISLEMTSWLWSFGVLCEIAMLYWQGSLLSGNLLRLIELATATTILRWGLLWLYPDSLTMAFLSQSLHAFNFALYYSASIAYVYSLYKEKRLAQQFFLGITFGLGGSVGAILAGWIYEAKPTFIFAFEVFIALLSWVAIRLHSYRKGKNVSV